jgi:hypothetical protein
MSAPEMRRHGQNGEQKASIEDGQMAQGLARNQADSGNERGTTLFLVI